MQVLQADGLWDSVSRRNRSVSHSYRPYRTVSHRNRTVSHRNRLVSRRIAPYRARIASSRTGSHRLVSSRTGIESSRSDRLAPDRLASESSRDEPDSGSPPCTSVGILVSNYTCLLSAQFAGKSSLLLANLTPVCAGVLLGLCSTSGPPWCSLWPSIVGGNHVAFAVLPAKRNLTTTHCLENHRIKSLYFLHTSLLQGVYSRKL